jgi:hypothetical protein
VAVEKELRSRSLQAIIFPHDEGVAVRFSGFEDKSAQTIDVICGSRDDAERLIKADEEEHSIEIPRTWHVQVARRTSRHQKLLKNISNLIISA